jgi:hypothetical protein
MKSQLILVSAFTFLVAACGGGGGNNNTGSGLISDTSSATYSSSLKAFAETTVAGDLLLPVIFDVVNAAAYTGTGNGGGVISATSSGGSSGATTFTNAKFLGGSVSNSPAISGVSDNTYTVTGLLSTGNVFYTNNNTVKNVVLSNVTSFTVAQPNVPNYSITELNNVIATSTPSLPSNLVSVNSGSVSFLVGNATYALSDLNVQAGATSTTSFYTTNADSTKQKLFQIAKGSNSYAVNIVNSQIATPGQDSFPSAGALQIVNNALPCSPITLAFLSQQQFSMSCGGNSITKNWSDLDVRNALLTALE